MALTRPLKEGSVTTYQEKVTLGFKDILASEADGDHDTMYAAWNGALGGDLTGTLPNPTVVAAAKSKWTVSGATLTPTDATKRVSVPGPTTGVDQQSLTLGSRTQKTRLGGLPGLDGAWLTVNQAFNGSAWARDDAAQAAVIMSMQASNPLALSYYNAAGTPFQLLSFDNVGNLALPGAANNSVVLGSPTVKSRLQNLTSVVAVQVSYNLDNTTRDDTSAPGARLYLQSGAGNESLVYQRISAAGASTSPFMIAGGTGDLTITGNNATKNTGTTWANPSDPRLKQDIAPYAAGLAEISKLAPITYRLKAQPDGPLCYGFDASAVRDVFPECVTTTRMKLDPADEEETDDVLVFDMHPILVALVNAIRELAARGQGIA